MFFTISSLSPLSVLSHYESAYNVGTRRQNLNIPGRLDSLRRSMDMAGVDAYIITGSDPHASEYPPSRWRTREWISGFTGSAGIVAVTRHKAGLWTDFRYWIQAFGELQESGLELFRDGQDGLSHIQDWLVGNLSSDMKIGYDGRTVSDRTASEWDDKFSDSGIGVVTDLELIGDIWIDRPLLAMASILELEEDETGESRFSRLDRLSESLASGGGADTWLGIGLDSVAWLLNVRGGDVPYNPVVTGFLIKSTYRFLCYNN